MSYKSRGRLRSPIARIFSANTSSIVRASSTRSAQMAWLLEKKRTTARAGCVFHGWFGVDGVQVDEYDAVAAANHTLYAMWSVTVTFDANGGVLGVGSRDYVLPNTYGVFPGVTREGYTLTGWWTAATGGAPTTASTRFDAAGARAAGAEAS